MALRRIGFAGKLAATAALVVISTSAARAATDGFKCTGTDGRIEYRELAVEGMTCTPLRRPAKPAVDAESEMEKLRERVDEVEQSKQAASDEDKKKKNCETARSNLEILDGEREVVQTDQAGKQQVLNEEQRAAARERTQKDVDYWCN